MSPHTQHQSVQKGYPDSKVHVRLYICSLCVINAMDMRNIIVYIRHVSRKYLSLLRHNV